MIDNPFKFGILQKVRRLFVRRQRNPEICVRLTAKEHELLAQLDGYIEQLSDARAALASVIHQWGPITFAEETIEANKNKQLQIVRENGFVKIRLGAQDDFSANGTAAGVQRFSRDTGEHGDGAPETGREAAEEKPAPRDPGRVWYDHSYTGPDLPRDGNVYWQNLHHSTSRSGGWPVNENAESTADMIGCSARVW